MNAIAAQSLPAEQKPSATTRRETGSPRAIWIGRVLTGLGVLFLVMDSTMKLLQLAPAVQATVQLGYPATLLRGIGLLEVALLVIYLMPRTAILGAILWTGYLGGAVASHLRLGDPLFSHVLFPIYIAAFLWAGLWLRDPRLHHVFDARR